MVTSEALDSRRGRNVTRAWGRMVATGCTSSSAHTCHILAMWFLPSVRADKPRLEAQHHSPPPLPAPTPPLTGLGRSPLPWAVLGMWLLDTGLWQAGRLASWQVTASELPRTFDTLPYKLASWNAELSWLDSKSATNRPSHPRGGWIAGAQGSLETGNAHSPYCLGLCLHQGGSQHGAVRTRKGCGCEGDAVAASFITCVGIWGTVPRNRETPGSNSAARRFLDFRDTWWSPGLPSVPTPAQGVHEPTRHVNKGQRAWPKWQLGEQTLKPQGYVVAWFCASVSLLDSPSKSSPAAPGCLVSGLLWFQCDLPGAPG